MTNNGEIWDVSFPLDRQLLASTHSHYTVRLWEMSPRPRPHRCRGLMNRNTVAVNWSDFGHRWKSDFHTGSTVK